MTYDLTEIRAAVVVDTWDKKAFTFAHMLSKCARQFRFYAEQHKAKGTPDADAKAKVNTDLVVEIALLLHSAETQDAALKQLLDDAELGRMVRAAAEMDGPEREAMIMPMVLAGMDVSDSRLEAAIARAAAQALIAHQEKSRG